MTCPDCKGTGRITLLISVAPCERCGGAGKLPAPGQAVNDHVYPPSDFSAVKIESVPDGEGGYTVTRTFVVEGID